MTPHQINLLCRFFFPLLSRPCDSCKRMHSEHEHFVLCMFIDAINSLKYASPASFVFALFACTLCFTRIFALISASSSTIFSFSFLLISYCFTVTSYFIAFIFFLSLFFHLPSLPFLFPLLFLVSSSPRRSLLRPTHFSNFNRWLLGARLLFRLSLSGVIVSSLPASLFPLDLLCHTLYFFVLLLSLLSSLFSWFLLSLVVIFNVSFSLSSLDLSSQMCS